MKYVMQSERLNFRRIEKSDFESLKEILQDIEVMYAWEHAFSDEEVWAWIDKNITRYNNEGFSYFAVIKKDTNEFIGVSGPLIEEVDNEKFIGVAYIFNKKYWNNGYATESAKVSIDYAFNILKADKVIIEARPENLASCKVAQKIGMQLQTSFIKYYKGKAMEHLIYIKENNT